MRLPHSPAKPGSRDSIWRERIFRAAAGEHPDVELESRPDGSAQARIRGSSGAPYLIWRDDQWGRQVHPLGLGILIETLQHERPKGESSRRPSNQKLQEWLENPAEWSPFVDEVAVERALGFDWGAIGNLSRLEAQAFLDRLIELEDPLGEYGDRDRFLRWSQGCKKDRRRITKALSQRRRK